MPLQFGESDLEPVGRPEESWSSVASAAWDNMAMTGTFVGSTIDGWKREGLAKMGKPVTPAEANKMFPGLNADRDITLSEAEFIMNKKDKVKANQDIIDSASDSFLKGTVLPFVSGAARAMVDPIDMGINLITGGVGTGLKVGASLGRKVAIDAVEAAVGATIAEAAVAKEMTETFEDYTAKNFLTNVIGASVLQVGIMHGIPAAGKATMKTVDFMGAKTSDGLMKFADVLESKGINTSKVMDSIVGNIEEMSSQKAEIELSIKNTLEGKVEVGDDMIDSVRNVMEAHEAGRITDAEFKVFAESTKELGIDQRIMAQAADNSKGFGHNSGELAKINDMVNDPKNKQGYNHEAQLELDSLDDFDPVSIQEQHIEVAATTKADDVEITVGDKTVSTGEVKAGASKYIQEQEIFKEFAACKRGL